ncbi:MAG TPA: Smr/MutS family protein [Candidatus Krumholzibacteria bacterium]|nr:Smr/MutS family protein [Candidatus Krumholzibacteria bacterium]
MSRNADDDDDAAWSPDDEAPAALPLDGVLDLHAFRPQDVKDLVPDWLEACRESGILDVRIIHGKGIGVLRTIVQGILSEHPGVESFAHPNDSGSWGATVARLRPRE